MSNVMVCIAGNISNPELRFTPSGKAVFNFSLAVNKRVKDASGNWSDGEPTWYKVAAWEKLGENAAATLTAGTRAIVYGSLENRPWDKDGEKRLTLEVNAEEIGADLRFHTGEMVKADFSGGGAKPKAQRPADNVYSDSEEPF